MNLENKSVRQILRAAQELWTRDGYHGASLKEIAAAAGVAKSLVHYHFESKEHLLIELQADWSHRVAAAIRARLASAPPSVESAFAALDQVWESMVATRAQFPFALEVWRQSLHEPSIRRRLQAFERELRDIYVDGLRQTLGPLADRMSLPPERAAAVVRVLVDGLGLRLFLDDDVAAVRRVFDDVKLFLATALLTKGTPP
ncbi:MAG TPA: TetR/AcrR family transcriptional regulator [Kofleriaceae bacterium]|nr:TetR/AcrR family transcriptional regulator [Kofleriaceae bacterium]